MIDRRPGALGAYFTPPDWARWALDRLGVPAQTAAGATVCDPTAGEGAFALALAEAWAGPRGVLDRQWAHRITLVEREGAFLEAFAQRWHRRWGFAFPESNLVEADIILSPPDQQFDFVVGNPPWITYPDLPADDQIRYRPWFGALGLVEGPKEVLLGRSRLDLAALVTARTLGALVKPGGRAGFFLPLSLFHNEGAPGRWRVLWPTDVVFDLTEARPFPGVSTRCGWAEFSGRGAEFPSEVPYFTGDRDRWQEHRARRERPESALRVVVDGTSSLTPHLALAPWQKPRQGVNTGGLNAAFHVASPPPNVDPTYVHPLVGKRDRWILVPYTRQGKPIDADELERSGLAEYWAPWKPRLEARRGTLLGAQLARGRWWALLGVGAYAFAPYKVVWSAYGQHRLDAGIWGPRDDGAVWQADQALQAYVPCQDEAEAQRVAGFLNSEAVAQYLAGSRAQGTRSWAQPGRFKELWLPRPGDEGQG